MTGERICACGCGEPIPPDRRPDAKYASDSCKDRAYQQRKAGRAPRPRTAARPKPKPAKPKPAFLPKREKPAVSAAEQVRARQRHERLQARLEQRVGQIARDFRGGGGRRL